MRDWLISCTFPDGTAFNMQGYVPAFGKLVSSSVEADVQTECKTAYTQSNLYVRVIANDCTAISTVRSRVNLGYGGQTASIGAGLTGVFEDTSNSDSLNVSDDFDTTVIPGSANDITISLISYTLTSAGDTPLLGAGHGNGLAAMTVDVFFPPIGACLYCPTTADSRYEWRTASVMTNLRIYVNDNSSSTEQIFQIYKAAVAGSLHVHITASTTGEFRDDDNSDSYVDGDLMNYKLPAAGGGGSCTITVVQAKAASTVCPTGAVNAMSENQTHDTTVYYAAGGTADHTTSEVNTQMSVRQGVIAKNFYVRVWSNSLTGASTIKSRVGGADGNAVITVGAGLQGVFEDLTHTDVLSASDLYDFQSTAGAGTGANKINMSYVAFELLPDMETLSEGLHVYVDWDGDGTYDGGIEDITAYVMDWNSEIGVDPQLGEAQVGTAEIVLNNQDKRFSPKYAGPLFGLIKPLRQVRIFYTSGGTDYDLFNGYLMRITPNPDKEAQHAYMYCVDTLGRLKTKVTTYLYGDDAWIRDILAALISECERSGETISFESDIDLHDYWLSYAWFTETDALEACLDLARHAVAFFGAKKNGSLYYANRRSLSDGTSQFTWDNLHYKMLYSFGEHGVFNKVYTGCHERVESVDEPLWSLQSTELYVAPGESITIRPKLEVTPVLSVDTVDYEANSESDGLGIDLTDSMSVTVSAGSPPFLLVGGTCALTITNTGGQGFYILALDLIGTAAPILAESGYTADDATSQDDVGIMSDSFEAQFISDPAEAESRSRYILAQRKDPGPELVLTARPKSWASTDAILAEMLATDMFRRVHVHEDITSTNQDFYVYGIKYRFTMVPKLLEMELLLVAVPVDSGGNDLLPVKIGTTKMNSGILDYKSVAGY